MIGRSHKKLLGEPRGFTLVELLVVIVVIAILATIAIVSYTGVTERAYNATTITTVRAWIDTLEEYDIFEGGQIQLTPASRYHDGICFGDIDDYPATSHLAEGECAAGAQVSQTVTDRLKDHVGDVRFDAHEFRDTDSDGDGGWLRGIVYDQDWNDNTREWEYYMFYNLYGHNQDCGLSGSEIEESSEGIGTTTCQINVTQMFDGEAPIYWY